MTRRRRPRISQRAARAALRELTALRELRNTERKGWGLDWPNGVHLGNIVLTDPAWVLESARTARRLRHVVIAVPDDDRRTLILFALPLDAP